MENPQNSHLKMLASGFRIAFVSYRQNGSSRWRGSDAGQAPGIRLQAKTAMQQTSYPAGSVFALKMYQHPALLVHVEVSLEGNGRGKILA
ncbi:hypothetical protein ACO0LC_20385 [Undibacterium sp. JH2W]|uniref:hypothetical protein n=1 Tax=Undibacterium sp. JH2W TaxID=3413037 RepID=UPI003BF2FFE2